MRRDALGMSTNDLSFSADDGLLFAVKLLSEAGLDVQALPEVLPEIGLGELSTLEALAPCVISGAARLDQPLAFAHMDPPTPWITWAMALWNSSLNQNLLHEATSPFATEAEKRIVDWLAPSFGMRGGHLCSGSSIANLTALWAARDSVGIERVVASDAAHLSVKKAAQILGLEFESVPSNYEGKLEAQTLSHLDKTCLVLTAGTTATGTIDPLELAGLSAWTHVDAAWGGPLRLTSKYGHLLDGIDQANSVAISGHKLLFQPKDSAIILFRDPDLSNAAIGYEGGYLANRNVGVQGSRGAAAIPLLATLLAWGRDGLSERIEKCMKLAELFADLIDAEKSLALWGRPETGVVVFRPKSGFAQELLARLPAGMFSTCTLKNREWLRSVAANPMADVEQIFSILSTEVRDFDA